MQSVQIKISISSVASGSMFALSFDLGEKLVKTSLMSDATTPFKVILLSPPPVTRAECIPNSLNAQALMFLYKYLAVSAKAVNTITFLFPGLIGLWIFKVILSFKSLSLPSLSEVIFLDSSSFLHPIIRKFIVLIN